MFLHLIDLKNNYLNLKWEFRCLNKLFNVSLSLTHTLTHTFVKSHNRYVSRCLDKSHVSTNLFRLQYMKCIRLHQTECTPTNRLSPVS